MAGPWEKFQQPEAAAGKPWEQFQEQAPDERSGIVDGIKGFGAGVGKGVGSTALGAQRIVGKGLQAVGLDRAGKWLQSDAEQGRARLEAENAEYKTVSPFMNGAGELTGEITATLPVGGVLAKAASPLLAGTRAAPLLNAVRSSGMRTGLPAATTMSGKAADIAIRSAGGAATGGVSAGLVNPGDAGMGAAIGGALPGAAKLVGATGRAVGRSLSGGGVNPEVVDLALRAKQLGIDVPVDRIANSKPLNAVAAGLNYVPFSGRAGTEAKMQSQLNKALSRTFGQNSDDVTTALRKAKTELGGEFDRVLKSNSVKVDSTFLDELAEAEATASRELGSDGAGVISRQIDEIMNKGASGELDGQAAYNIKRMLDRIGKRSTPEAHYAGDLRRSLMSALDRSMSPDAAKAFATTRKQYGNMLTLEKLAQNGVDGDVSIARIANMKNIGNADLQELADISAQFLKPRESAHGAAQRAAAGLGIGGIAGLPALAGSVAGARGVNSLMNSNTARNMMLRPPGMPQAPTGLLEAMYRAAPLAGNQ